MGSELVMEASQVLTIQMCEKVLRLAKSKQVSLHGLKARVRPAQKEASKTRIEKRGRTFLYSNWEQTKGKILIGFAITLERYVD
jgi:hypothetical protein